jgi:hypothetical protein
MSVPIDDMSNEDIQSRITRCKSATGRIHHRPTTPTQTRTVKAPALERELGVRIWRVVCYRWQSSPFGYFGQILGRSIAAAASVVGNMAVAPFLGSTWFVYPVVSAFRRAKTHSRSLRSLEWGTRPPGGKMHLRNQGRILLLDLNS